MGTNVLNKMPMGMESKANKAVNMTVLQKIMSLFQAKTVGFFKIF